MRKEDIIYLAGIIDGEGTISVNIGRKKGTDAPYLHGQLRVANTNLELINWLVSKFSGSIIKRKKKESYHKQGYEWHLGMHPASEILKKCRAFLIIKKEQAELFIKLADRMKANRSRSLLTDQEKEERKNLIEEFRQLNKKGR